MYLDLYYVPSAASFSFARALELEAVALLAEQFSEETRVILNGNETQVAKFTKRSPGGNIVYEILTFS